MEMELLLWGSKAQRTGCVPLGGGRGPGHVCPGILERPACEVAHLIVTGFIHLSSQ